MIGSRERDGDGALPVASFDDHLLTLLDEVRHMLSEDPRSALSSMLEAVGFLRERCAPADLLLTPAERRVVVLAAAGAPNREIAERLYLSVRTVESHLSHAYAKLGIGSKAELAAWWALEGHW